MAGDQGPVVTPHDPRSEWGFLPSFAELEQHSDEELRKRYDHATSVGQPLQATFALEEIHRRESNRRERRMLVLTWAIAALTVVNVAAVVAAIFR